MPFLCLAGGFCVAPPAPGRAQRQPIEFRAEAFNVLNHPNFANPVEQDRLNAVVGGGASEFGVATAMLAKGLAPIRNSKRVECVEENSGDAIEAAPRSND